MKPDMAEFRALVLAFAEEYGAYREDLIAVARERPPRPVRRGRPTIDDDGALDAAARLRFSGAAASDWKAAVTVAKRLAGQSADATAHRLFRAMREGRWSALAFYKRFPGAARVEVIPDPPFARAQRLLYKIRPKSPN